jgi:hypothetical protein
MSAAGRPTMPERYVPSTITMPSRPNFSGSVKPVQPKATSNLGGYNCAVCIENPKVGMQMQREAVLRDCCKQFIHRTHDRPDGKCAYSKCPSHTAQPAAAKASNAAANAGVKPVGKPGEVDFKSAAAGAISVQPAPATTASGAAGAYNVDALVVKSFASFKSAVLNALTSICKTGSDLLPLLATHEEFTGAFKPDDNDLLKVLCEQTWEPGEKENLRKSFADFKDVSKLTKLQLIAYNQVKEYLNPLPLDLAYVYAKSATAAPATAAAPAVNPVAAPLASQTIPVKVIAALAKYPSLSLEEAEKMLVELFKKFEAGTLDFQKLVDESGEIYLACRAKHKDSGIAVDNMLFNAFHVQNPKFFDKARAAEPNATDDDCWLELQSYDLRIIGFKAQLKERLRAFVKEPNLKTFNAVAEHAKPLKFDSVAFLTSEFKALKLDNERVKALADFFDSLSVTAQNEGWIKAFKPIVDEAKKALVVVKASAHAYSYA